MMLFACTITALICLPAGFLFGLIVASIWDYSERD